MNIKSWYLGIVTFENGYKLEIPGNNEETIISKTKELCGEDIKLIRDFCIYEVVSLTNVVNKLKLS